MARRKKRSTRREPEFKSARVSLSAAELGWLGSRGGRTVEVEFRDGDGGELGTLKISAAHVRWHRRSGQKPVEVSAGQLGELFAMWRSR